MEAEEVQAAFDAAAAANGSSPSENGSTDERINLLARVREMRIVGQGDHHLDLPIPGLGSLVWARFAPFPIERVERKMNELMKSRGKQPILLKASCDTLIDSCEQIMLLPERFEGDIGLDGINLIPIDDDGPIKFDSQLGSIFGFESPTARGIVRKMFPTEQAIIAMSARVTEWMQDVTKETDESLLGES